MNFKPHKEKTIEELKQEITRLKKELKKKKKYGLVWEEKSEDVVELCKEKLPVLKEVESKEINTDENKPTNILIEGDNYHALSVLNYTHAGKIDVIYIDPPYNTGAKDWKYNNDYVESTDAYRHSKWISMMYERLKLSRKLLTKEGIIIVAIDEYEIHNIRHLLDQIFGEQNKLGIVTVLHNPKGRNLSNFFSANSEFMLVYAMNIEYAEFNEVAIDEDIKLRFEFNDDLGNYRWQPFLRARTVWSRKNKPKNWYPIYVSKDLKTLTLENKTGYFEIWPVTRNGKEMAWKNIPETFNKLNVGNYFKAEKEDNNRIEIYHKYREQQVFKNVWIDKKYQSEFHGTNLLKKILGGNYFDYPKSVYLVLDILKITSEKNSIILDFFAGSGTTAHAVLELNKADGGNRKFILCTNNENNICTEVCYPRVQKVIEGYKINGEKITGLSGNLKYFKTEFVKAKPTDKNKKILTDEATEMLCLREDTFEKVKTKNKTYKIFKNQNRYTGIVFDPLAIDDFKEAIKNIKAKFSVYVFSLGDDTYDEEFEDMKTKVKVQPIPEAIMRVYRRIFK